MSSRAAFAIADDQRHEIEARFWSHVTPSPECWDWNGKPSEERGRMSVNGRLRYGYRISYALFRGDIPAGLNVCHHCDNPACVRPDHLFLGTDLDNVRDMVSKGRLNVMSPNRTRGERHPRAKNTADEVRLARSLYATGRYSQEEIGRFFGVTGGTVSTWCTGFSRVIDTGGARVSSKKKLWLRRNSCQRGHDWSDPRNINVRGDGRRYCAECDRQRQRHAAAARKRSAA